METFSSVRGPRSALASLVLGVACSHAVDARADAEPAPAPTETSRGPHEDRNPVVRPSGTLVFLRTSQPDAILYDGDTEVGAIPLDTGVVILASQGFHQFALAPRNPEVDHDGQRIRGAWQEIWLRPPGPRSESTPTETEAAEAEAEAEAEAYEEDRASSIDVIRNVVRGHMSEIIACYEEGLARRPTIEGRVRTRFVIGPSGEVQSATVTSTEVGDAVVEECITTHMLDWVFPAVEGGGIVIVNYPWALTPR